MLPFHVLSVCTIKKSLWAQQINYLVNMQALHIIIIQQAYHVAPTLDDMYRVEVCVCVCVSVKSFTMCGDHKELIRDI